MPGQHDATRWVESKAIFAERILQKTRDEWEVVFEGSDACFAPVLEQDEAKDHPQLAARDTFVEIAGVNQPAPAPRFGRTPSSTPKPPSHPGQDTEAALGRWGFAEEKIASLFESGAIR